METYSAINATIKDTEANFKPNEQLIKNMDIQIGMVGVLKTGAQNGT